MFGNREKISCWFSIIINNTYLFNCVFRKCFSSFFIRKEEESPIEEDDDDDDADGKKEEESPIEEDGKKEDESPIVEDDDDDADGKKEDESPIVEEEVKDDKELDWEFPIMLYILSYFCIGAFTKSFIFGMVKVVLKKCIKWWTTKINMIDNNILCNIQNSIWLV